MKESEAKTKWCPMKRSAYTGAAFNWLGGESLSTQINSFDCGCIGSACMLWKPDNDIPADLSEPTGDCGLKR